MATRPGFNIRSRCDSWGLTFNSRHPYPDRNPRFFITQKRTPLLMSMLGNAGASAAAGEIIGFIDGTLSKFKRASC